MFESLPCTFMKCLYSPVLLFGLSIQLLTLQSNLYKVCFNNHLMEAKSEFKKQDFVTPQTILETNHNPACNSPRIWKPWRWQCTNTEKCLYSEIGDIFRLFKNDLLLKKVCEKPHWTNYCKHFPCGLIKGLLLLIIEKVFVNLIKLRGGSL